MSSKMLRTIGILSFVLSFCLLVVIGHSLNDLKSRNDLRNISENLELLTTEEPTNFTFSAQTTQSQNSSPRLSLVYRPQRPTFAGQISTGLISQLISPGKPWPANSPTLSPTLLDRFGETTVMSTPPVSNPKPTTKSPLEYRPQKPSYAGVLSEGHLGQLVPSGESWSEKPSSKPQEISIVDRLKETTARPSQDIPVQVITTKPSFDHQPQRPTFVVDPPNTKPILSDQFKETIAPIVTTKAPLESRPQKPQLVEVLSEGNSPQRPTFAGGISGGNLGSLIPPGKPWPADSPNLSPTLEDQFKETTATPIVTTKAPLSEGNPLLDYQPQRPTFAGSPGGISGGNLGSLIPPGKPWPADPPNLSPTLEDRFKDTTATPIGTTKTPLSQGNPLLDYQPQRPTFAGSPGGISGGHLGQLIPPGKPWPADPPNLSPTLEDRFKETTAAPIVTTKAPLSEESPLLDYQPQRPTFAGSPGGISGGNLGQLIPPGKPWPADPPNLSPTLEDRFKETTATPIGTTKAPLSQGNPLLDYQPQRPTFAGSPGGISGGHLGQLIPPGKPWPADPPNLSPTIADRFKETTAAPIVTTKAPLSEESSLLDYQPQRPTFAGSPGGISGGNLGQLIPPGKPWPADPPNLSPTLEDRFKETTATPIGTTKAPLSQGNPLLDYQPQRPTFAGSPGGISGGHLGQLIPPGKPWPADPPNLSPTIEDRFKETTAAPIVTTKAALSDDGNSPLDYQPQRPSFAGSLSGGSLGQLIPPGKPWPAQRLLPKDQVNASTS